MSTETFITESEQTLRFVPIEGLPNAATVDLVPGAVLPADPSGMSEADWDKFEKDIAEAFEQVP
ncbi:MAG: hypothetical protein KGS61_05965 [Verrucomicrobia bacterium]|nr:hypothetical protein [Verrucomicrobiota bacterium]